MSQPAAQGFRALHAGFIVAPIIAGLDKFFNLLTDWTQYLAPVFPNLLGIILNLLLIGQYLDVALRDLGLAIGTFALARLAEAHARATATSREQTESHNVTRTTAAQAA